jgi:hypothetical protein
MRVWLKRTELRVTMLLAGGLLFLTGCDQNLQTTVENGVITTWQSLLGAFLRALIALGSQSQSTTTT